MNLIHLNSKYVIPSKKCQQCEICDVYTNTTFDYLLDDASLDDDFECLEGTICTKCIRNGSSNAHKCNLCNKGATYTIYHADLCFIFPCLDCITPEPNNEPCGCSYICTECKTILNDRFPTKEDHAFHVKDKRLFGTICTQCNVKWLEKFTAI